MPPFNNSGNSNRGAGFFAGRYSESPIFLYTIDKGNTKNEPFKKGFSKTDDKENVEFGKYGLPNVVQIRNNSSNRLELIINGTYEFQLPAYHYETFPFEEEEIKKISVQNLETYGTDDKVQIFAQKTITQNMVNKAILSALGKMGAL